MNQMATQETGLAKLPEKTMAILRKARSEMFIPGNRFILPKLRIAQDNSVEGVDEGHFYIEKWQKLPGSESSEKTVRNLGANPSIAVLKVMQRYEYFVQSQKKMMAYTNVFSGFGDQDIVYLVNNRETPYLEAALPFQQFKEYYKKHYFDNDEGRSKLKFKKVIYVLAGGEICEMDASKSSMVGIPEGEQHPDYKQPQELSFQHFEDTIPKSEIDCLFSHWVKIGTKHKAGTPSYYYILFEIANRLTAEELESTANKWVELGDVLEANFDAEFGPLIDARDYRTVTPKSAPASYVEAEVVDDEIKAEDLPF